MSTVQCNAHLFTDQRCAFLTDSVRVLTSGYGDYIECGCSNKLGKGNINVSSRMKASALNVVKAQIDA